MSWAAWSVFALHLAAAMLLASMGAHRLVLALRYRRRVRPRPPPAPPAALPSVTVQIPLYNERHVAERAVLAAGALRYPRDLLEIQVLDDSTDETTAGVAGAVARLRASGVQVVHLRRRVRSGYKAGALAAGLARARGELIAIFDADFVPPRHFLRSLVGEFRDPTVGMVQARWGHLNAGHSLLTRAQALQLDAHFTVEHGVRAATGCFFNFNGTAGIWRRQAIESAGGWRADTLTEDLDLSYRAQLAGWRFVYRDDLEVPGELPVEVAAYRLQQQRWARGGAQTARLLLPAILRAPLPSSVRAEALWHLTSQASYPLLVLLTLAGLAGGWVAGDELRHWMLAVHGVLLGFATLALGAFYGVAARARDGSCWRRLPLVPVIMLLGAGIALGQTVAVCQGLAGQPAPFRRTPKYRLERARTTAWRTSSYRIALHRAILLEGVVGSLVLVAFLAGAVGAGPPPPGVALLLGAGMLGLAGGALAQQRGPTEPL